MVSEDEVLGIDDIARLRRLTPGDFAGRKMSLNELTHIFGLCDAFWMHSGDPEDPHAELTSGTCSNGFINCMKALNYTNICQIMAHQAVFCLRGHYQDHVDWVIGSAYAGIDFSKDVANILNARHGFTEKGDGKEQLWQRLTIPEGEIVLQVEELMTTSLTTEKVREGIRKGNPTPVTFAPYILALVHRSDVTEVDGSKVIYPFHFDIWTADPSECELCAAGSERLRPKQNWAKLAGKV